MAKLPNKTVRNIGFFVIGILLVAIAFVAFTTYNADPTSHHHIAFAVKNHVAIMIGLLAISVIFGFASSQFFYKEIKRRERDAHSILGVVLLFLNREEREILNYLVARGGETSQAEISRLPHMDRVRAHRTLKKMQERELLTIIPHGKVRRVVLKEHILELLRDQSK